MFDFILRAMALAICVLIGFTLSMFTIYVWVDKPIVLENFDELDGTLDKMCSEWTRELYSGGSKITCIFKEN